MQIRELSIPDAYEITPVQHADSRGLFLEWYRFDRLEEVLGHSLTLRQGNPSVSAKGVLRGIHFAEVPNGQAKYVTVVHGTAVDFVVDLRVGSPTFGQWDSVFLDDVDRKAVYLAEGLGHAFLSLTDGTTVSYLVNDVYNPSREHALNPMDPAVGLTFPEGFGIPVLSPKDEFAPNLEALLKMGTLPAFAAVQAHYDRLNLAGA